MRPDDFYCQDFVDDHVDGQDPWTAGTFTRTLNTTLLESLRRGPIEDHDDVEVAVGLARLIHDELEKFGADNTQEVTEPQMRDALLALHRVVERAGIVNFDLPFRDYGTFKSYWLRNGARGSWQARRDLLNDLFHPLHDQLIELETRALSSSLAQPISPARSPAGPASTLNWPSCADTSISPGLNRTTGTSATTASSLPRH